MSEIKVTLRDLRENSGLTQLDVAKQLNVSLSTFRRWEDYETFPDCVSCIKLCEMYQCQIDDIYFPDKLA